MFDSQFKTAFDIDITIVSLLSLARSSFLNNISTSVYRFHCEITAGHNKDNQQVFGLQL